MIQPIFLDLDVGIFVEPNYVMTIFLGLSHHALTVKHDLILVSIVSVINFW